MDKDILATTLLDLVINYERGALNCDEVLTAIFTTLDDYPLAGQTLFEVVDVLDEGVLAAIGVPLTLLALATCGDDYGQDRYERLVDHTEAALLDYHLDHDGSRLEALAKSFPHFLFVDARPLIARILYPYQMDSCDG